MPKLTGKAALAQVANFIYGDHVLGWAFNISLTVVGTYIHFIGSPDLGRNDFGLRVMSVIVSQAVVLLGINLSYRFCKFFCSSAAAPYWFIGSLPFIGAARGFAIQYALFEFEIMDHVDFLYRMIGSAIIIPLAVAFIGYLIGVGKKWVSESSQLRKSHQELNALLAEAESRSDSELTEDLGFIKSELLKGLQSSAVAKNEGLVALLTNLVSDVLKPMSANLVSASPLPAPQATELAETKFNVREALTRLSLSTSSNPWVITAILIASYAPVLLRFEGLLSALEFALVALACAAPILWLLQKYASKWVDRLGFGGRLPLLALLLSVAALPFALVLPLLPHDEPNVALLPLKVLVTIEIVALAVGLGSSINQEVRRMHRDLLVTAAKIRWRTAHLYSTHWFNKRQFARKLHGPIQAEVLANIVRLEREPDSKKASVFEKDSISSKLVAILNSPRVELKPSAVLSEIAETWDGICQITVNINPTVENWFREDQVAAETVLEIIREACSNSIHHGKATTIEICVGPAGEDCISLSVQDNGTGLESHQGDGIGSRHLLECSIKHSLKDTPAGTTLTALLPVVVS